MMPYQVRRWFRWSEWRWLYRRFIGFFQRGWRGYADHDVWGLDHYLASVLAPALRRLADTTHGIPMEFMEKAGYSYNPETGVETPGDTEIAFAAWKIWLREMADWFEWYDLDEDGISDDKGWIAEDLSEEEKSRRIQAYMAKMEKFLTEILPQFVKHWGSLWD